MLEVVILALFSVSLIICVAMNYTILYALIFGYFLFFGFGLIKGNTWKEMLSCSVSGILTVKNILIIFMLIGVITAVWRACGTIAFIVYYASMFAVPQAMVLMTFVLRCVVSDGYCLRKRGDDRRYLHDLGKQYAHSGDIHRRCNPFRHLFRRPLFTDVIGCESYLRTDQN